MLEIERMSEAEIPALAPLAADFRAALNGFRGTETAPDPAAGAEELREHLAAGYPVFTAKKDGAYCGYIVCRVEEPCVWAEALYVRPDCRRQGIASALFRKAEELAASYGEDSVYNYVHPNNAAVIAFLRSRGYSVLNLIEIRRACAGETPTRKIRIDEQEFDY